MSSRRHFLASVASAAALVVTRRRLAAESAPSVLTVYKDPGCECCARWVKHMAATGFVVSVRDVSTMDEIKKTMRVPAALQSCHTGVIDKYVFEGHVPAADAKRFLAARSTALGLAVPGMPMGSPGMEGGRTDHYNVVAFNRDGTSKVYAKY